MIAMLAEIGRTVGSGEGFNLKTLVYLLLQVLGLGLCAAILIGILNYTAKNIPAVAPFVGYACVLAVIVCGIMLLIIVARFFGWW